MTDDPRIAWCRANLTNFAAYHDQVLAVKQSEAENRALFAPKAGSEPIKCSNNRCYSPLACEGFGYCRERNVG